MIRVYLILFCLSIQSLYCVNKTEGTKTSFKETNKPATKKKMAQAAVR